MSQFLRKALHFRTSSLVSLQNPRFRWFSVSSVDDKKHSFTVSYLMNSLGFSPKTAQSALRYVSFYSNEKPDKAIEFFTNYGFTETQISSLVRGFPRVLLSDTEKTMLPKLEFLKSKGISVPEMAKMVSSFPCILRASLTNQIIPSYDFLRNFFQSDKKVICASKRYPDILSNNSKYIVSSADILREYGVPESKIAYLIEYHSRSFVMSSERFRKVVDKTLKMGFDVSTRKFADALHIYLVMSKLVLQKKSEAYKKCGFSEEEISKSFRRDPNFMAHSEGKIMAVMDFFVNEMKWRPSIITSHPVVLGLSLAKRTIPRCSVYKALLSKGLVKKVTPYTLLGSTEKNFLKKFVEPHEKVAPELLELYQNKLVIR